MLNQVLFSVGLVPFFTQSPDDRPLFSMSSPCHDPRVVTSRATTAPAAGAASAARSWRVAVAGAAGAVSCDSCGHRGSGRRGFSQFSRENHSGINGNVIFNNGNIVVDTGNIGVSIVMGLGQ